MAKLLSKVQNISLEQFTYQKKLQPHSKAKTCDVVSVLCNDGSNLDIVTFRTAGTENKKGKILRRFWIKEKDGDEFVKERKYKQLGASEVLDYDNHEFINVTARNIFTINKKNGKFVEKTQETQSVAHRIEDLPVICVKKIISFWTKNGEENETQSMFQYKGRKDNKGYVVEKIIKDRNGFNKEKGEPIFYFQNFSKRVADKFKKDPYFLLHLYSKKEFTKIAPKINHNPKHPILINPTVNWFEDFSAENGFTRGNIYLNKFYVTTKPKIIAISAHEKEHSFQIQNVILYLLEKGKDDFSFLIVDQSFIERCKKAFEEDGVRSTVSEATNKKYIRNFKNYIHALVDRQGYRKQPIEAAAFKVESMALTNYVKSSRAMDFEFPYAMEGMVNFDSKGAQDFRPVKKGNSYVYEIV